MTENSTSVPVTRFACDGVVIHSEGGAITMKILVYAQHCDHSGMSDLPNQYLNHDF